MLVVMLVLLVATAGAAVATRATQSELRAAGNQRQAVQTQQLSEIALLTALTYFDRVDGVSLKTYWEGCADKENPPPAPLMYVYGQPAYNPGEACRLNWSTFLPYAPLDPALDEVAPLSQYEETLPDPAPPPGPTNLTGSFGPRQAYMPQDDFILDLHCIDPDNKGEKYYCELTAHSRTWLPGYDDTDGGTVFRSWSIGGNTYNQNPHSTYHQARATLLTKDLE
jgi:hypothetical protein